MKYDLGPDPLVTPCPERKSLEDIEAALERLDKGEFGYCASCGAAISLRRLCQDPTITLCWRCDDTVLKESGD